MIEFRQLNNLTDIISTYSVVPQKPQALIKAAPSTLIYVDAGQTPAEPTADVHLALGSDPGGGGQLLMLESDENVTYARQTGSLSCCAQNGDNQLLLFVSDSRDRIIAHNVENDIIQWQTGDNLPGIEHLMDVRGVTTDGRGHLFLCDFNNYAIQMFSVSDGQYLGCLIKEGKQSLGKPARISWCKMTSSLIVAHLVDRKWTISVIQKL